MKAEQAMIVLRLFKRQIGPWGSPDIFASIRNYRLGWSSQCGRKQDDEQWLVIARSDGVKAYEGWTYDMGEFLYQLHLNEEKVRGELAAIDNMSPFEAGLHVAQLDKNIRSEVTLRYKEKL